MGFQLKEEVSTSHPTQKRRIREINQEKDDARRAGYFKSIYLVEVCTWECGVKGGGDKEGSNRDGHHGSGCLCNKAII